MKDYNFMISDDRLHKTRFCKKKCGANQKFSHKEVGWSKRGGLERLRILRGGGFSQKEGGNFFKEGGSYPGAHNMYAKVLFTCNFSTKLEAATRGVL